MKLRQLVLLLDFILIKISHSIQVRLRKGNTGEFADNIYYFYRCYFRIYIFTNSLIKGNKVLPIVDKAIKSKKCDGLSVDLLPFYFKRSEYCLEKIGDSVKMIVKPDAAFTAWGHELIFYRSDKYTKDYIIPDTLGLSYHYRPHWNNYKGCSTSIKETRVIEKFFTGVTQCTVL